MKPLKNFKPGQKVRCIRTSAGQSYIAGNIYEVKTWHPGHISTVLDETGSRSNGWLDEYFVAITPKKDHLPPWL